MRRKQLIGNVLYFSLSFSLSTTTHYSRRVFSLPACFRCFRCPPLSSHSFFHSLLRTPLSRCLTGSFPALWPTGPESLVLPLAVGPNLLVSLLLLSSIPPPLALRLWPAFFACAAQNMQPSTRPIAAPLIRRVRRSVLVVTLKRANASA